MKCLTSFLLLLMPAITFAQDFIITNSGDSIECTITLVNDQNIFYTYKKKKHVESTYISLQKVSRYIDDGNESKPVALVEPDTIQAESIMVDPPQRMKRIGVIITGFLLQGIGSMFTIIATAGVLDIEDGRPIVYVSSGLNTVGIILIVSGFQGTQAP